MAAEAVISVILNETRSKVVLIKRRDIPVWVLPGGGIELNENLETAITREVLEETGLHVRISRKVAEYTPINRLAGFTHLYECKIIYGKLSAGTESHEVSFFSLDALPKHFFYIHKQWLDDALKDESFLIQKSLTHITYRKGIAFLCRHPIWGFRFLLARAGFPINT